MSKVFSHFGNLPCLYTIVCQRLWSYFFILKYQYLLCTWTHYYMIYSSSFEKYYLILVCGSHVEEMDNGCEVMRHLNQFQILKEPNSHFQETAAMWPVSWFRWKSPQLSPGHLTSDLPALEWHMNKTLIFLHTAMSMWYGDLPITHHVGSPPPPPPPQKKKKGRTPGRVLCGELPGK